MPSEFAERRAARGHQMGALPPPPTAEQQEPLPCPRCDSTNTKFCYYNNYNFSQPRHFCKSCRRYWTHGGTLRDIPIGGGSRKAAKRSRTTAATSATTSSSAYLSSGLAGSQPPIPSTPLFVSLSSSSSGPGSITAVSAPASSFTSLLNGAGPGVGILPTLGGFGLGLGLEDVGFGLGHRGVWAVPDHQHPVGIGYLSGGGGSINGGEAGGGSSGGGDGGGINRGDTWQVESGESDFGASADCFASLPELAISTPGNGG
ncbi:hypothetical protein Cgig2_008059 [Carnegiea gigantea]|uniref:Dof zinc finger protein n=1 Tax=Carnegiea gigantea TaxID=171969 RepID=A0A9Q1L1Z2_9CARY|nr:hypothetical protein Cgig2_008059 [Carnegiea gigantea]